MKYASQVTKCTMKHNLQFFPALIILNSITKEEYCTYRILYEHSQKTPFAKKCMSIPELPLRLITFKWLAKVSELNKKKSFEFPGLFSKIRIFIRCPLLRFVSDKVEVCVANGQIKQHFMQIIIWPMGLCKGLWECVCVRMFSNDYHCLPTVVGCISNDRFK